MTYDLETRVTQFHMLKLPGQPMMMHMGTSYLVNDLWREVLKQRARAERLATLLDDTTTALTMAAAHSAQSAIADEARSVLSRIRAALAREEKE